jgi:tripartite motif-containing protein 71
MMSSMSVFSLFRCWISKRAFAAIVFCMTYVSTTLAQQSEPFRFGSFQREVGGLFNPTSIVVDDNGTIFVAESVSARITMMKADGTIVGQFGTYGRGEGRFISPRGIAVRDGHIFITDAGSHSVQVYDTNGTFLRRWGGFGKGQGQFNEPVGIFADNQRVYVADSGNNRVSIFNPNGKFISSIESEAGDATLDEPSDVAVDASGHIYVTQTGSNRISKFDSEGKFLKAWGEWGPFPGLLDEPTGIELAGERLFVTDRRNHRVQTFDLEGKLVEEWGLHELTPHEGKGKLHYPEQLAISPDGTWVAVVEGVEDRVQFFSALPAGGAPEPAVMYNRAGQTHFGEHISADGTLLVIAEPENHFIFVFETSTEIPVILNQFGERGDKFGLLLRTAGIHLDFDRREILVSDVGTHRLQQYKVDFDPDAPRNMNPEMTRFATSWDFQHLRDHMPEPKLPWPIRPAAIKRDAQGNLDVIDSRNHRIHVFDVSMKHVRSFGQFGAEAGQFNHPTDVSFSRSGEKMFVVDSLNRRVQVFDKNGKHQNSWSAPESGQWNLVQPFGITSGRDGFVYVTDVGGNSILKFEENGTFVKQWGAKGAKVGELWKPRGVTQDERMRLIVVDHGNHRAQIYDQDGNWLVTFGAGKAYTERNKPRDRPEGS